MPQEAAKQLRSQTLAPVAMSTRSWDRVDAQLRERAFFMAGVDNARTLAAFRQAAEDMAAGKLSLPDARERLRKHLAAAGYEPAGDDAGTIHDLRSRRRLDITLQTNVDMARGWAERRANLGDTTMPGQELYRRQGRRQPRDWVQRWQDAAEAVGWQGVARDGSFVALLTSPIWAALSRFGYPYPPFDFQSGMGVRPVDEERCRSLGLLSGDWVAEMERAEAESLNAGTEVDLAGLNAAEMDALDDALQGVADVVDGRAVMRDVNGTTPHSAEEMANILASDMPEEVPNLQRAALEEYAAHGDDMPAEAKPALRDLLRRTEPVTDAPDLWHEMDVPEHAVADTCERMEKHGFTPPTDAEAVAFYAAAAAARAAQGMVRVRVEWVGARSARDLCPLFAALEQQPQNALHLIRGQRLHVVNKTEQRADDGSRIITYTVKD